MSNYAPRQPPRALDIVATHFKEDFARANGVYVFAVAVLYFVLVIIGLIVLVNVVVSCSDVGDRVVDGKIVSYSILSNAEGEVWLASCPATVSGAENMTDDQVGPQR